MLVDYAHTDDALKNLLETVRGLGPRRVITVFGCGGDRDRSKRPLMGAVAARLSDVVILTSDNPRSEPPEAILDEIRRGIPAARAQDTLVIPDRRDAIARALEMGREGVCVVIAGKGHETYQVAARAHGAVRRPPGGARRARPPRRGGREEVSAVTTAAGLSLERVLEATAGRLLSRRRRAGSCCSRSRSTRARSSRARSSSRSAGPASTATTSWPQRRRGAPWPRSSSASSQAPPGLPLVRVADTTRALADLARHVRRATSVPVVAVTGSVGKTTTKDMTAELLGARGPVLKTEGNLNNQYGLPLTLLRLTAEHSAAVLELGMSAAGEIRALAALAEPDVATITRIAPVHLEFFASLDAIADAKAEILEGLRPGGTAVLNGDDPRVRRIGERFPGRVVWFGRDRALRRVGRALARDGVRDALRPAHRRPRRSTSRCRSPGRTSWRTSWRPPRPRTCSAWRRTRSPRPRPRHAARAPPRRAAAPRRGRDRARRLLQLVARGARGGGGGARPRPGPAPDRRGRRHARARRGGPASSTARPAAALAGRVDVVVGNRAARAGDRRRRARGRARRVSARPFRRRRERRAPRSRAW